MAFGWWFHQRTATATIRNLDSASDRLPPYRIQFAPELEGAALRIDCFAGRDASFGFEEPNLLWTRMPSVRSLGAETPVLVCTLLNSAPRMRRVRICVYVSHVVAPFLHYRNSLYAASLTGVALRFCNSSWYRQIFLTLSKNAY